MSKSKFVPVCSCLVVQLCVGIIYLWSVFNSPVTKSLGMTPAKGSLVSSVMLLAFVVGTLIGGFMNDRKGPRFTVVIGVILFGLGIGCSGLLHDGISDLIYLSYGIMGGLGSGFCYTACLSCVQKWFPGKRGFASGLAAASFGLSTVVFAPLSRALMNRFTDELSGLVNFMPVFFILGGIFLLLGLAAGCFIRLPRLEDLCDETADSASCAVVLSVYPDDLSTASVLKLAPFWCIFFTIFCSAAAWTLVLPLISDLGVERGLSLAAATLTVSLTGVVNAVGRLALASLSDKIGRHATIVVVSCLTILAALLLTFIGGIGYSIAILILSFAYGGPGPLAGAFAVDFFGAKNSARNFGLITLSLGLTSVFCNVVSTNILNGSPFATFIMAACMAAIPIGLMYVLKRLQKKQSHL